MIIPYWVIVFFVILNIIGICLNLKTEKNDDRKRRAIISIYPRLYFLAIYIYFWIVIPDSDIRSMWGRWGILAIFIIESWIQIANFVDHCWQEILFYWFHIVEKIKLKLANILYGIHRIFKK